MGYPKARWYQETPPLGLTAGDASHDQHWIDQHWIAFATALGAVGVVDTQRGSSHFLTIRAEFVGVRWIKSGSGGRDLLLAIDTSFTSPRVIEIHVPENWANGASLEWEEVVPLDFTDVATPGPMNLAHGILNDDASKALIFFVKADTVALFDLADGSSTMLEQAISHMSSITIALLCLILTQLLLLLGG